MRAKPIDLLALAVCAALFVVPGCDDPFDTEPIGKARTFGQLGDTPGSYAVPRAIDADGKWIWIVDRTARIQRIDPTDGRCVALWRMPVWELGKPTGITVAPGFGRDRVLWVADTHYHRVMVYAIPDDDDITGKRATRIEPELITTFGTFGTGEGEFIYPTDVAVLEDPETGEVARVYVSEYGSNDRVSAFDPSLNFLFSFGEEGVGTDPTEIKFARPQSVEICRVGEQDEIVVTDSGNHRLGRFTLDGELITWIGRGVGVVQDENPEARLGAGNAPGEFNQPYGLFDLEDGTVLVAENGNNRVQRVDLQTGESKGLWGSPGREKGQLMTPWGVVVLDDEVFVLDTGNHRVTAFPSPRSIRR